jgi:hypothetical protein
LLTLPLPPLLPSFPDLCPNPLDPRRDEALSAIEKAIEEQHEQELTIAAEIKGYQKDIVKEQLRNEQLTSIVNKVSGEAEMVTRQTAALVERQEVLAAQVDKLSAALEGTEERIKKSQMEGKVCGFLLWGLGGCIPLRQWPQLQGTARAL